MPERRLDKSPLYQLPKHFSLVRYLNFRISHQFLSGATRLCVCVCVCVTVFPLIERSSGEKLMGLQSYDQYREVMTPDSDLYKIIRLNFSLVSCVEI